MSAPKTDVDHLGNSYTTEYHRALSFQDTKCKRVREIRLS